MFDKYPSQVERPDFEEIWEMMPICSDLLQIAQPVYRVARIKNRWWTGGDGGV